MSNQIAQGWVQYDEEIIRAGQEACQQIGIRFSLPGIMEKMVPRFCELAPMIPSSPRCVGASMVNEGETHAFAVETVGGVIIASSLGI